MASCFTHLSSEESNGAGGVLTMVSGWSKPLKWATARTFLREGLRVQRPFGPRFDF